MGNLKARWTDEETELLIELWPKTEIDMSDLKKIFNRKEDSIRAKRKRLDLPARSTYLHSNINREYLEKMYKVIEG